MNAYSECSIRIRKKSEAAGLDQMSMKEIDAEISKARRERHAR